MFGRRRDMNIRITEDVKRVNVVIWARRRSGPLGLGVDGCWG